MDDFLHNLRSGKLKQADRTRREYDYNKTPQQQQQQRRSGCDRRRTDYYAKITNEHFMLIRDAMNTLAENQKRITEAMGSRNQTLSRMTMALEALAAMIGRKWGYEDLLPPEAGMPIAPSMSPDAVSTENSPNLSAAVDSPSFHHPSDDDALEDEAEETLRVDMDDATEEKAAASILNIISAMRVEGESWKKIAEYFDAQQIPTLSGRGKWSGPAVKKIWEAGMSDPDTDADEP